MASAAGCGNTVKGGAPPGPDLVFASDGFAVPCAPVPDVGGVAWRRARIVGLTGPATGIAELARRASAGARDSLAAWEALTTDALFGPEALRRVARLRTALGDTAGADSAWRTLAASRSIRAWEAVQARCGLALARRDTAGAERVVGEADAGEWPEAERAEWLGRRARLRLALRDTVSAIDLARRLVRFYPTSPSARPTRAWLEGMLGPRDTTLAVGTPREAAGEGLPAAPDRWLVALRRAETLRGAGRFMAARTALARAEARAPGASARARCLLERARILRDADALGPALRCYERVGRESPDGAVRATAWWECAREAEAHGLWVRARLAFQRSAVEDTSGGSAAWLRAGLTAFASGHVDSAEVLLARAEGEAARFWEAVVMRSASVPGSDRRARADSALRLLGEAPGFTFYRTAARETLGIRTWPGGWRLPRSGLDDPALRLAAGLEGLGLADEALLVLDRWVSGDPRLAGPHSDGEPATLERLLEASRIEYAAGRPRRALRYVERALAASDDSASAIRWDIVPWFYPPAYDSLFAAFPESTASDTPDRDLLRAVAWKESRFDALARSRSDAVGLLQLKRAAIKDVAAGLNEPVPAESAQFDPGLSLRYGARYLERQMRRFPGDLPLALAAYNAGARVVSRWPRLRFGGAALTCEEIPLSETRDYVMTILATRRAYRELKPTLVEP